MKKTWNKSLALCLTVLMVLSSVPLVGVADFDWGITAKAADGYCGENVTYTYDSKTGELVISGEGDMYAYDQYDNISPFYETDIKTVVIEDGVTAIGDYAFCNCTSLTSVTIPDSVTAIGDRAFDSCYYLSDITIGSGVTTIGIGAFYATKYYTTVSNWDIDEALYIGNYLIKVKPHDDKYAVKEDTVVIAGEALRGLDVRVVYIPDTVKNIGREAFLYCNNLKYVYFGGTEEEWSAVEIDGGNDCLINASSYYYSHEHTTNDGTVAKEPNCKEDGEKRARCIFCEALLIEKIPASHTEIAVSGKPATCTVPGYTDSSYCEVCGETIKASEEISTIPHTDEDSNGICDVCNNYMDDVESLGYCGENKEDAEYILYKDGTLVISGTGAIDSSCFYGWSNIKKVVINEGIKKIGESCFNNCSELVEVSLPSTLEEIGDSAFANCSKLMGLNIPDSVTKVGQNILANTPWHHNQPIGLLTLDGWILGYKGTMPESYTLPIGKDIKGMAEEFILRWEINDFDLEEENLYYTYEDGVLYNKDKTVLIRVSLQNSYSEFIVPDTVKTIGANAFQKNNGRRVVLPATLENIENNAFLNAGLTNLDIPASVKKLGHASLFNVTNVYYPGTLEQWQAIEGSERAIADNTSLFLNHTHSYAEPVLERDNCENYGNLVYNCIHGDFYSLVALPTEHIWEDEYTVETEATCTSQGYKYIKCSVCEVTKNHEWFYEEHSWSDWTTVAPNCDEWNDGYDIRTCSACGAEETANYVSPSHSWSDWTTVAPDCDEWNDGYDIRTCSGCGTEETANYISPEHSWSDWTEVEGDCSQDKWGYYERTCFGCGEKDITSEIAPECHYVEIFTPATTSSSGEITTKCEKCGDIADYEYIPQITYIELSSTTVTYNGKVRTPSIVVRNDYGQRLTEGLSYNYEYLDGDMINPGVYRVKVSFKGRYAGEEILNFTIVPGDVTGLTASGRQVSADLNWDDMPGVDAYRVLLIDRYDMASEVAVVTESNYRVTGLTPGTYYTFAVQAGVEVAEGEYLWGNELYIYTRTYNEAMCDHVDEDADRICDICEEETLRFAGNYNNTVFKLYTDGTLIISGYGTAYCRWQNYREFIKKVIVEEGITGLGSGCLAMCLNMEDVSLPATLEAIYDEAFYSCESLKEIEIPESVEYLGNSVFSGCNSLESLTIPEGIAELRYYFASGCTALKEVNLPSTIEALGDGVFADCTALETIDLPEGLVRISGAFKNCTALKEIDFPASLEAISYEAFRNCDALAEVSFPENLREIGYAAFCDCDSLTEIEIPATVENVEYLAFANCTSLKKVKSAAKNLLESTFSGCNNLEEAELLEGTETIGWGVFSNCGKLSKVSLPDTVTTIEGYAFSECFALEEIDIPDAVEFLSYNTFYRCHNLKKVDLGNIKGIDSEAFADCIRLEEITLDGNVEAVYRGAFKNCIRLKKVTIENPACDIASYIDTFPEKTVIYGYEDSTAQKYAVDWMRNFVSLGGEHTHRYNEAVTVEPTCTEKGVKTFTCSCGRSYTEEIAALGHNEITLNATAATCTTSGLTEGKSCQRCQEILIAQQTIPEAGHNMAVSEELSVAPTCKDAGKSVKVCTTCGAKEETTLPADANAHKIEWTSVTATCTQKGSRTGKCSVCQKTETQEIPALGHDIADGEWVVVNAATCSTQGDKVAVCNRCRATIKEKIPTVAHKDANSDNKCDVCGATVKEPTPTDPPKPTDPTQPSQPDTPNNPADECDCGCHKDGIAGFFFRFILFFQKLFGANETCQCGEAHY